ncbi:MAG: hypothetical protein GY953_49660, partial [bacterium]|nr:hypothetical protein [bacterium]
MPTPVSRHAAVFLLLAACSFAANPDLLKHGWDARWVWVDGADPFGYGVYHFRRGFELAEKPSSFLVHVTADNRYQLFVNGERVVWGPARGDLYHWRYESVDIAAHLRPGNNVLAAVVWNDGEHRGVAQISNRTAFLLQGDTAAEEAVNTGANWIGVENKAYRPIPITMEQVRGYVAIPPGEEMDGSRYPWGWERPDFDDSAWKPVAMGRGGSPRKTVDAPSKWMLVPRSIPLMEETPERLSRVRTADGIEPPSGFPRQRAALRIPARTRVGLLLDQDHLTTGYPELTASGGKGATVSLRYGEALWNKGGREKGHRDD